MEMNRPEAERCVEIALKARALGDLDKAERFCQKSLKLFPSNAASRLLAQIQTEASQSTNRTNGSTNGNSTNNNNQSNGSSHRSASVKRRANFAASQAEAAAAAAAAKPTYTAEQRNAAKEMLKCKNHYDRLGVARTATEVEIKSAYRRKAMLFHPDRNSSPEAEEAFKAVSAAFQCLSDPAKRRYYNQTGEEDNSSSSSYANGAQRTHTHQYYSREADLTPEDIFNMFFGGVQTQRRPRQQQRRQYQQPQQHQHHHHQQQQQPDLMSLLSQFAHFLPLLLLLFFSFLNAPSGLTGGSHSSQAQDASNLFSLSRSHNHPQHRQTRAHMPTVDYFVDTSFAYRYARDSRALQQIENLVVRSKQRALEQQCNQQKAAKDKAEQKARKLSGAAAAQAMSEAFEMGLDACERLQQINQQL